MKALTWQSRGTITCETVPDPKIEEGRDVIIKVTACAICGSDLHLMGGFMPTMECGDISATRRWARSSRSGVTTGS